MVSSGKAKRLRREERVRRKLRRDWVRNQIEGARLDKMNDSQIRDFMTKWMSDEDGFDYMLGNAVKTKNYEMITLLKEFKETGRLSTSFTITRAYDGSLKPPEQPEEQPVQENTVGEVKAE